jgi:hypothetical protein
MDYEEFIKKLNELYFKYFNKENCIKSSFDADKCEIFGSIFDKIYIEIPNGYKTIKNKIEITSTKKEYSENGIYAKISCKGDIIIIPDNGNYFFKPEETFNKSMKNTGNIKFIYKKFDKLFSELSDFIK